MLKKIVFKFVCVPEQFLYYLKNLKLFLKYYQGKLDVKVKMLKPLFHLIGFLQFFYGCYYDLMYVYVPSTSTHTPNFGSKFKFLTYINAMLQTTYYAVSLLNDCIGTNEPMPPERPLIRQIKDILFSALAFPLSMFVGLSFWGIYAVDRELILPKSFDPYFPSWLNHVMHTNILFFILAELIITFRMYPLRNQGLAILSAFMLVYMAWVHYIYYHTGGWVYPILAVLNWPLRITFYIVGLGLVGGLYTVGETLNKTIWSKEVEKQVKSGKKKAQ